MTKPVLLELSIPASNLPHSNLPEPEVLEVEYPAPALPESGLLT